MADETPQTPAPFASGILTPFFNFITPVKPYFLGALSGIVATCCIQPLDIVKSRLQIQSEQAGLGKKVSTNPFVIAKNIMSKEGFSTFYTGLS